MQYKLPKTLVLDYRKWICGAPSSKVIYSFSNYSSKAKAKNVYHGSGETLLLNENGYMCCLGQFACQAGAAKKDILSLAQPDELEFNIIGLSHGEENTHFSNAAIDINDDEESPIWIKIRKLKALCKKYGRSLKLKNVPKTILKKVNNG